MIENRDILVFSDDWGKLPSTLQHITKILLQNNRVFWIGSLGLRKPQINLYDLKRAYKKLLSVIKKEKKTNETEVKTISPIQIFPFVLPFHNSQLIRKFNAISLRRKILRVFKEYKVEKPIILTSSPVMDEIIGSLDEKSSHYFCLDEYSLFENAFESIPMLEKRLVNKVDCVFSISEKLQEARIPNSGNSYFIPQGAEIEHFVKADVIPKEVATLKHPVIGFFGLISEWINLELIEKCIDAYPNYNFLFLGKNVVSIEHLKEKNNFIHLGEIPYKNLPKFASIFDIGIIPFRINELTLAVNPLKLIEYLSLGLPVVSTNMPEVKKFDNYVLVSDTDEQFIKYIKKALEENSLEMENFRKAKAAEYTWISIAEYISNKILESEIKKKS